MHLPVRNSAAQHPVPQGSGSGLPYSEVNSQSPTLVCTSKSQRMAKSDEPSYPHLALSLSDRLALERTRLANERTLLAYFRTGMALIIGGLSLMNFFRDYIYVWIGAAFVPLGVAVVVGGWSRYRFKRQRIHANMLTALARA